MSFATEKRRHPRVPAKLALKYRLLRDNPSKSRHTQSLDLSEEGMSFQSSEYIPHKAPILVEFTPPDMHRPISYVSEVVHAREHTEGHYFIIGMEFEHMLK